MRRYGAASYEARAPAGVDDSTRSAKNAVDRADVAIIAREYLYFAAGHEKLS